MAHHVWLVEMGRGGACVPACVAPQGRIHRSSPRAQYVCFWYGNAASRTFGRAYRHRPYGFVGCCALDVDVVWADCVWAVGVVGVDCVQMVILFVCDAWKNMMEMGRGGACVPARVAPQGRIRRPILAYNACIFGMETPLRGRSGGHTGTAPTVSFGWITCGWLISFGQIMRGRLMSLGRLCMDGWFCLGGLHVNG